MNLTCSMTTFNVFVIFTVLVSVDPGPDPMMTSLPLTGDTWPSHNLYLKIFTKDSCRSTSVSGDEAFSRRMYIPVLIVENVLAGLSGLVTMPVRQLTTPFTVFLHKTDVSTVSDGTASLCIFTDTSSTIPISAPVRSNVFKLQCFMDFCNEFMATVYDTRTRMHRPIVTRSHYIGGKDRECLMR